MPNIKFDDFLKEELKDPEFKKGFNEEVLKLDVAVAITELRKSAHLTQRELAEKVGKPQSTIARIEKGNTNVSIVTLAEIADALGKTVEVNFA